MSDPQTMKSLARHEFEAWAHTYDRSLLNHFLFRPSYEMFLEELYAWRGNAGEPFDLLDIGCGTGTFHAMLVATSLKARVVGMDYSPAMCEVAANKAEAIEAAGKLHYAAGDSEHLPFADDSFDVVTCSNSFHHYPHQQDVVRDMRRVLRPQGRLMLIDGFRDNIVGWVAFDVIIATVEKQVHHAPWTEVRGYFETAGFREIRHRKFGFWMPLLLTTGVA